MRDEKSFYDGFEDMGWSKINPSVPKLKKYTVYLFRATDCKRGWLAYVQPCHGDRATLVVTIEAESGAKAKNKAITAANNDFEGVDIVGHNLTDDLWGIKNFPELEKFIKVAERI